MVALRDQFRLKYFMDQPFIFMGDSVWKAHRRLKQDFPEDHAAIHQTNLRWRDGMNLFRKFRIINSKRIFWIDGF